MEKFVEKLQKQLKAIDFRLVNEAYEEYNDENDVNMGYPVSEKIYKYKVIDDKSDLIFAIFLTDKQNAIAQVDLTTGKFHDDEYPDEETYISNVLEAGDDITRLITVMTLLKDYMACKHN